MTDKNYRIFLKDEDKTSCVKNYMFEGNKCHVFFDNGKRFTYNASNVRIEQSAGTLPESNVCFKYLKRVAGAIGLIVEVEPGKSVNTLSNNYDKIDCAPPRSMLASFLSGNLDQSRSISKTDAVYPFGFNASQKDAVDKALTNRLSIIEGPPGTGKTQTILNIIANAVMRKESVAVVSSNNSSTKNVIDKLEKYGVDFIAAYLGNSENKHTFLSEQEPLPNMSGWQLEPQIASRLRIELETQSRALCDKLRLQNELSRLRKELTSIETEQKHFHEYAESVLSSSETHFIVEVNKVQYAIDMWLLAESFEDVHQNMGIVSVFRALFEWLSPVGRQKRKIKKLLETYSREQIVTAYQRQFYELKISVLRQKVSAIKQELMAFDFGAKMKEYSEISMQLFRDKLVQKYSGNNRANYTLVDLWKNPERFISDYPVILSTTYSLRSSLPNRIMYDYVIVDESSQVDLCTGALALSCARKAIIVGDLKQLPNVVDRKTAAITDRIFAEFNLPEVYRYKNHSLLSAVKELFPSLPSTLLREHYRCHPKIIEFCNQKFYDGQLVVLTEPNSDRDPLMVYKTVEGNHERNHMNQRQIDVILKEIIPEQKLNTHDNSLGVVTPYRDQTNALQKAFAGTGVKADTVDKFQGRENDVIILCTVDNKITEFTDNANRLNVAVSRAINQLILVVSDVDAKADTNVGDLVRYIEYNNFSVVNSKVYSVFDFLYKSYDGRRRALLAKQKHVSKYDSENLMYALIKGVLKDERFAQLGVVAHVPLQMIVRDMGNLSATEKRYAGNILTHVDFLIFDRIGKAPRLVVEVDGVAFHADGSLQAERDNLKNQILQKYSVPIIRFRTDGSSEQSRLISALEAV